MDAEETHEEEEIPFTFGDSYNQQKLFEGYVDDDSYAEPYRYLTKWYLTSTVSNLPHRRYALPKNGKFKSDHILFGYLLPSDGARPLVKVKIPLHGKTWVVDRSITLRGIWVTSGKAWYWLQEPCDQKAPVRLLIPAANDGEPLTALLPSQVEVHLEMRALLGLISNLCDILLHSGLAENDGLHADSSPGRYLKHHCQKKPAELWEALRCRSDDMWEQYGNDKDGIITPFEPYDLDLLEAHASFVRSHILHYNEELSERCSFVKGLASLGKQSSRKKGSAWTEDSLNRSAQLSEHRSQREPWGAPLSSAKRFRPNWVLEAKVQMAAAKVAATKAAKSQALKPLSPKRKRSSDNADFLRKQLKRSSLRKKEMPVASFRTLDSGDDDDKKGSPERVASRVRGNALYDTDEEHNEVVSQQIASKSTRKNKIARKKAKKVAPKIAQSASADEEQLCDDMVAEKEASQKLTLLPSYSDERMREALQSLHRFVSEYVGRHDWESLNSSTDLQYTDLQAAESAYEMMLLQQTPTPEAKLLFALLFRNACLGNQNKIAKKPFQMKSNPAKLLFEDWRKDAIRKVEKLEQTSTIEELFLVTLMRCIEACDVVKEFKQLDGLKQKKAIDWEAGISETLELATRIHSEGLVQACSAANSRVENILSRVAAKEAAARKEAEEQSAKEEIRRNDEERRKKRAVEKKLAIEAVRRHTEALERKKKEESTARKQKEQGRQRPLKMKDLMARHAKVSPLPSSSGQHQEHSSDPTASIHTTRLSVPVVVGEHGLKNDSTGVVEDWYGVRDSSEKADVSALSRAELEARERTLAVQSATLGGQNGVRDRKPEAGGVVRKPEGAYHNPKHPGSMFGVSVHGATFDPTRSSDDRFDDADTDRGAFKRTSYSQLADRKGDSRMADRQTSRVVTGSFDEASFRRPHHEMGGTVGKKIKGVSLDGDEYVSLKSDTPSKRKADGVSDHRMGSVKRRKDNYGYGLDDRLEYTKLPSDEPSRFGPQARSSGRVVDEELKRGERYETRGSDGGVFSRMDEGKYGRDSLLALSPSHDRGLVSTTSYPRDHQLDRHSNPAPEDGLMPPYESQTHMYSKMEQDRYPQDPTHRSFDVDRGPPRAPEDVVVPYVDIGKEPRRGSDRGKRYADIDRGSLEEHDRSFSHNHPFAKARSRSRLRDRSAKNSYHEAYGVQDQPASHGVRHSSDPEHGFRSTSRDVRQHYDDLLPSTRRDDAPCETSRVQTFEEPKASSRYSSLADDNYHERLRQKNEEHLREVTRKRELDKFMAERSSYQKRLHIQSALGEGKLPYEDVACSSRDQSMSPNHDSNEPSQPNEAKFSQEPGTDVERGIQTSPKRLSSDVNYGSNLRVRSVRSKLPKKRDNDSGNRGERSSAAGKKAALNRAQVHSPVGISRNRGQGRGVSNLPAWMTRQGLKSLPQDPPEAAATPNMNLEGGKRSSGPSSLAENAAGAETRRSNPQSDNTFTDLKPSVNNSSAGRGRGRVLPAWMTREDKLAGSAHPTQSAKPARQPSAQPPPNPQTKIQPISSGRGRGRNLPAWMTWEENLLGKTSSSNPAQSAQEKQAIEAAHSQKGFGPNPAVHEHSNSEILQSMESRTRQSKPSVGLPSSISGRGMGRGRGVSNLPAWMTRTRNDVP
uniref:Uncharacterized protein n=1 Tax=Grammatophora oceanica TaxID=210454 RepID=A0A7S1YM59_9STRA|mmetsp:Transcript_585/g.797  ORF Transcript_585/g.797 Transcript_585/m.797 type:complete len:1644 (+) Transcript_585:111-5042(+)|eukprot:CAMPEP_0194051374 /NCGR_PEP_ID=MMETSP0009_2-20130614/40170_1 /TAXON_ID=210454 /ORGANISM="Grammatophora oceanica, Strain CCMP 410" /LENGTH=1643 /DNA_ID=CAMNT_0038698427 /DNA_START=30 /DNA_END=4961 /DNA_ORIENTATION=-